jgi:hypothetical protein
MATDRYTASVIDGSLRSGWLTTRHRLGVLADDCPGSDRTYAHVIKPRADAHHIAVDRVVAFSCYSGSSDLGNITAGIQNAALKFAAAGVNRVMYLTNIENAVNPLFAAAAESQQYRPGYMLSSLALITWQDQIPPNQIVNMHGVGWMPSMDVEAPPATAATRTCRALAKAGGAPPPAEKSNEVSILYITCDPLLLLQKVLVESGGADRLTELRSAAERLGSSYSSVSALAGQTLLGASRHDGAEYVADLSYKSQCSCFSYDTAPRRTS